MRLNLGNQNLVEKSPPWPRLHQQALCSEVEGFLGRLGFSQLHPTLFFNPLMFKTSSNGY